MPYDRQDLVEKLERSLTRFYIIGHNAADSHRSIRPWLNMPSVSHLEIDVRQTRKGFKAIHSSVKGILHAFRLWPFATSFESMIEVVTREQKDLYIDYKKGSVVDLVRFLEQHHVLERCTFVIYGRNRAEELKCLAPNNDVFLHLGRNGTRVFDIKPNTFKIGVCLSPSQLTRENVAYMKQHDAKVLATFINSLSDAMKALAFEVSGMTTDLPHLAAIVERNRVKRMTTIPGFISMLKEKA